MTSANNLVNALANYYYPQSEYYYWMGHSGISYIHTVYPFANFPGFAGPTNYIFVKRHSDGSRQPLYIGQSDNLHLRLKRHEKYLSAILAGANEIHVHYLSGSKQDRLDIETDLRHEHITLLNEQPINGLAGILNALAYPSN